METKRRAKLINVAFDICLGRANRVGKLKKESKDLLMNWLVREVSAVGGRNYRKTVGGCWKVNSPPRHGQAVKINQYNQRNGYWVCTGNRRLYLSAMA